MALGIAQNLTPALYGPRGQAYIQALVAKSDMGSYQAASNPAEEKAVLPHGQEVDRFDPQHSQLDEHTAQQEQLKQLRAQNR